MEELSAGSSNFSMRARCLPGIELRVRELGSPHFAMGSHCAAARLRRREDARACVRGARRTSDVS